MKKGVSVAYTDKTGAAQKLDAERLIVSVGRVASTGLERGSRGAGAGRTGHHHSGCPVPHQPARVWAVGDVVPADTCWPTRRWKKPSWWRIDRGSGGALQF